MSRVALAALIFVQCVVGGLSVTRFYANTCTNVSEYCGCLMDLSTASVTASSSWSGSYPAWKAVDGVATDSVWRSSSGGVQYIQVALAQVAYVMAGVLFPGSEDPDGHPSSKFQIFVGNDSTFPGDNVHCYNYTNPLLLKTLFTCGVAGSNIFVARTDPNIAGVFSIVDISFYESNQQVCRDGETYESSACTSSTDRVCSPCMSCGAGLYYSTACTASANRQCSTSCPAEHYCDGVKAIPCTVCGASALRIARCNATVNTVCSPCLEGTYSPEPDATACVVCSASV